MAHSLNGRIAVWAAFFILLGSFILIPLSAFAYQEGDVVKVGWFEIDGYQYTDESGNRKGYGYDYFEEIANYSGVRYEYVNGTWDECIDMLKNGEIDALSFLQQTSERSEYIDFIDYDIGKNYAMLVANDEDMSINPVDYTTFNGKKIGSIAGASQIAQLESFAAKNGFNYELNLYSGEQELYSALTNREIDLVLANSFHILKRGRVVAKFEPKSFYIGVRRGADELLNAFNNSISEIRITNPEFSYQLENKYYSSNIPKLMMLTEQEEEYLESMDTLRFGYIDGLPPFSYEADEEFRGITRDVIDRVSNMLGIKLEFVEVSGYDELLSEMKSGDIDLASIFTHSYSWANQNDVYLTSSYLDLQYSFVMRRDRTNSDRENFKLTGISNLTVLQEYLENAYPSSTINYCSNYRQCLEGVKNGKYDAAIVPTFTSEYYSKEFNFNELYFTSENYSNSASFVVSKRLNQMLATAVSKAVSAMENNDIQKMVERHVAFTPDDIDWQWTFYQNSSVIMPIVISVFLLILLLFIIIIISKNKYNKKLVKLVEVDEVTGGDTYLKFKQNAHKLMNKSRNQYALIFSDIQKFKYINDTFGYEMGNRFLKWLSETLCEVYDNDEIIARMYADSFVGLRKYRGRDELKEHVNEVIKKLELKIRSNGLEIKPIFKLGIYILRPEDTDIDKALNKSMYAAGTLGTLADSGIAYYTKEMGDLIDEERKIENEMHSAVDNGEFVPYFQAKVNINSEEIVGAEMLVRWNHPKHGMISPDKFIPFFEKNGFISKLDMYMFEQACIVQKEIINKFGKHLIISCNFSRIHAMEPLWIDEMYSVVQKYGLSANMFEIEITETIELTDFEAVIAAADKLKKYGFRLSIDDFGSGYSPLQLIYKLPIDAIKLDRNCFDINSVSELEFEIVASIVSIAHQNGIWVICEGIENERQENLMRKYGCYLAQGFLYSKPVEFNQFIKFLSQPGKFEAD